MKGELVAAESILCDIFRADLGAYDFVWTANRALHLLGREMKLWTLLLTAHWKRLGSSAAGIDRTNATPRRTDHVLAPWRNLLKPHVLWLFPRDLMSYAFRRSSSALH